MNLILFFGFIKKLKKMPFIIGQAKRKQRNLKKCIYISLTNKLKQMSFSLGPAKLNSLAQPYTIMVIYITIPFQDIDILLWYGYLNNHNGT